MRSMKVLRPMRKSNKKIKKKKYIIEYSHHFYFVFSSCPNTCSNIAPDLWDDRSVMSFK